MKCPKCTINHKYSSGMTCRCGYRFVFSPKDSRLPNMRDGRLLAAIQRVSRSGSQVFTKNQLYSAYLNSRPTSIVIPVILGVVLIITGLFMLASQNAFAPGVILIVFGSAVLLTTWAANSTTIARRQFDEGLAKWQAASRTIDGMIDVPMLNAPPENWPEDDIYDYGVERILVVQRPILVDLFVKNNQHSEQRMLVVSEDGYPEYLRDRTNQLMAERPTLQVYLLHDADAKGAGMAERIKTSDWFRPAGNPIIDLGFFVSDFENLKRTEKYRKGTHSSDLPVDALRMGSLTLGLSQCFTNQSTFAKELEREQTNEMVVHSSFG